MATTINDIRHWLLEAKSRKATHLVVVCDTFDYEDYPIYVSKGQSVHQIVSDHQGKNMQRVMEVYNVSKDWEQQLKTKPNFCY